MSHILLATLLRHLILALKTLGDEYAKGHNAHPRTLTNVTGDGKANIVGFGVKSVHVPSYKDTTKTIAGI